MDLNQYLSLILDILLKPRDFIASALTPYLGVKYALGLADLIISLLGATAVYAVLKLAKGSDKYVYYVLLALWIVMGAIVVLARFIAS